MNKTSKHIAIPKLKQGEMTCPFCYSKIKLNESKSIYRCEPCDAQVGVHKHNKKPLGGLAKTDLRAARKKAHACFDPMWRRKKLANPELTANQARKQAYLWLAAQLNISYSECHIGWFDIYLCEMVVEICQKESSTLSV